MSPRSSFFARALSIFRTLPTIPQSLAVSYLKCTMTKTRYTSHVVFLKTCLHRQLIPTGFQLKFHASPQPKFKQLQLSRILHATSFKLIDRTMHYHCVSIQRLDHLKSHLQYQLNTLCTEETSTLIIQTTQDANRHLHTSLKKTKASKLEKISVLKQPTSTNPNQPTMQKKLVVTIPEDLHLTESQLQLLSKGLKFIPLQPRTHQTNMMYDCQRYFRRLRLAAFFECSPQSKTIGTPDKTAQLFPREPSDWTPKDGQFPALDYYIKNVNRTSTS